MDRKCHEGQCLDPCVHDSPCSPTAECTGNRHEAQCQCPSGYVGNPKESCISIGCNGNQDCPNHLACIANSCKDPCEDNTRCSKRVCYAANHEAVCPCVFTNKDPLAAIGECSAGIVSICMSDKDCGLGNVCKRGQCVDPCDPLSEHYHCALNALCQVNEALPFKSIICTCPSQYSGDARTHCLQSMTITF